jgi:hypothetical protein
MERNRRILILKVILKSMLLFAVLWLLWVMLASIPGGPKTRQYSGLQPLHRALVCCHTPGLAAYITPVKPFTRQKCDGQSPAVEVIAVYRNK